MAITKKSAAFVSHGEEFATEAEAKRHDNLYNAREALQDAQIAFQKLLAENAVTLDGRQFEFGIIRDYWHVVTPFTSLPRLEKYCFGCLNWSVRDERKRPEVVEIQQQTEIGGQRCDWVRISELYASEKNALAALRDAQRKWLAEKADELGLSPFHDS